MATTDASVSPPRSASAPREVSLVRLYVLRAGYLLLVVGLGVVNLPGLISHEPLTRGIIPSVLGGLWLLSILGLRYPLQMLPLLMFELAWKAIWLLAYGLPQALSGQTPSSFAGDLQAVGLGVIVMPLVIPWSYVWRRYLKQPAERWR